MIPVVCFGRKSPPSYIIKKIGITRYELFTLWAFGETFNGSMSLGDVLNLWNLHHPDQEFQRSDGLYASIDKMIKIFLDEHNFSSLQ